MEHRPTLAVCLGHQLASLVLGCRVVKLPFGHHGANHPVKDLRSGRVLITSQNHNYAVDAATMPAETEITHVNLNDGTVEGLRHRSLPLWSVQFHPEASPGPHEATAAFDGFVSALTSRREEALGQDASGPDRMA
jgi:carbamoyl-phosphate synthase small subunit